MKYRGNLILISTILIAVFFALAIFFVEQQQVSLKIVRLDIPITHSPTIVGSYPFILGGKIVLENGTAYSYAWINASALQRGDSFTALPALNVGISGNGIDESNLTAKLTYTGSYFDSSPYWLNFTVQIPELHLSANFSQRGFADNFSRSSFSIPKTQDIDLFVQVSNVVNSYDEFELFFYVGNGSTPPPVLTHGPVN